MDFFTISTKEGKDKVVNVFPDFTVGRSTDLMVRGRAFYAIWDEERNLWSTDEYDVQRLVDKELDAYSEQLTAKGIQNRPKKLRSFNSQGWRQFRAYLNNISDNSKPLDRNLTFADSTPKKTDYVSRKLPYSLEDGSIDAWDELIGTLYSSEERAKIEWAIGAVVSGDSKNIQKFLVLYGPAGTGKSTVLNIINTLFEGYTTTFEARALGSNNNAFATEAFRGNPLVAIQHDGDLSRIEDNTKLNSIISHEWMTMNEKYKPSYVARVDAFLFMGTNQPVKISDAKSGIIRRLIDVHPTGVILPPAHYQTLMTQIGFEHGAIAKHCLNVYREMGKNYYSGYRPLEMMLQTDIFYNFVEAHYDIFKSQDGVSLRQAYSLYKEFCADTGIEKPMPQYKVREELRNYFEHFKDRERVGEETVRSYYSGFSARPFKTPAKDAPAYSLVMEETTSLFDGIFADAPAQYATELGTPEKRWESVHTTLKDLDTSRSHYVQVPENHIVIDFDLRNEEGEKDLELNLKAASNFPPTYAELSQSGRGVHLHYLYSGADLERLRPDYSHGIEVKVYRGAASLRRRVSLCNGVPVSSIASGLPLKEEQTVIAQTEMRTEKSVRDLIQRNLRKGIHPGTKPSIDFIKKILDDAYDSGMAYDVTDLRPRVIAFANNSSNQALTCLKIVKQMKWQSESDIPAPENTSDQPIVFFDCEVYPNLFVLCWKFDGKDQVARMINPSPEEVAALFPMKLVGFYNRNYDNHILYARSMGFTNEKLFALSQQLIENRRNATFAAAYGLSYADIYEFSSVKKSLKKFQVDLGLPHMEINLPWDQPVPDDQVERVVKYCENDVRTTEAVFHSRQQDFVARQILAELSGLTVNDTTPRHTAKIIFRDVRDTTAAMKYTDLSKEFPGYVYSYGKSTYKGVEVGEGGYVYAEPGIHKNVALLDIASMHPTTIGHLELFGPYTKNYMALRDARLAIKRGAYSEAKTMLDGRLAPFLESQDDAEALAYALKIVINIVYGLTSAGFDNPFRDIRNVDNIVAKRGALFMVDLLEAVQAQGFTVAHIKTDSIKIPDATPEIIEFVKEFGAKYGYTFEHEGTYSKLCLVNDAVYIAATDVPGKPRKWTAVGAQFAHPYVYKTLFTGENISFENLCETKQVNKGYICIDYDAVQKPMISADGPVFVGKTGIFVPVDEKQGGILYRVDGEKKYSITGTKGYFWVDASRARAMQETNELEIDMSYFETLADKAKKTINKFGDFEQFIKE